MNLQAARASSPGALIIRDDYEVRSAAGAIMMTTPNRDQAIEFFKAKSKTFPGLTVDHVQITETRRRAYRPRPQLVAS